MAITKEQIWLAADELIQAGEPPTMAAVRKKVGGGSFTTISEALKDWRQREEQKAKVGELVVPDPVRGLVLDAGKSIWQAAMELARSEVDGIKTALEAREKEIMRERAEALALADQVSGELEQSQEEIERIKEALGQAQAEAREAKAVSAEREQRILALERELKENRVAAEKITARAERLEGELERARSDLKSQAEVLAEERKARSDAEKQVERLSTALKASQAQVDRSRSDREAQVKALATERELRSQTEKQMERLTADLETVRRDKESFQDELVSLKRKQEEARQEYKRQFQKFNAQVEAEKEKRSKAEQRSAQLEVENARLRERSEGGEARIKELSTQIEFLQSRLVNLAESKQGEP